MSKAEETVFFVDENLLGRRIPDILRNAGVKVELLSDHFPLQTPDVEWLAEVSQRGWFVITRDMKIGINIAEAAAVAKGNAKVFALSSGSASQFCSPHPKSLSQSGRGTLNPAPLLPFWEKGLGDEGQLAKVGCTHRVVVLPVLKLNET